MVQDEQSRSSKMCIAQRVYMLNGWPVTQRWWTLTPNTAWENSLVQMLVPLKQKQNLVQHMNFDPSTTQLPPD